MVKLIHCTPDSERLIAYCARVSNPENQDNEDYAKLLAYCIKHGHWSIFEMASMCLEITTTRAVAPQILRHRSFSFQEFSQRYAKVTDIQIQEARKQDTKNRQNSTDDLEPELKQLFKEAQQMIWNDSFKLYNKFIDLGIAKESARVLLPLNTQTKLYMHGSLRSWIHYINLRTANGTQKEHADIANECKKIFSNQFVILAKALNY